MFNANEVSVNQPVTLTWSSNEFIDSVLAHCCHCVNNYIEPQILTFVDQWIEKLSYLSASSSNIEHQSLWHDDVVKLDAYRSEFLSSFLDGVFNNFEQYKARELATVLEQQATGPLSIVSNHTQEHAVAISSIVERAGNVYANELLAMTKAFARMQPQHTITDESNPISPLQFCIAFKTCLSKISLSSASIKWGYKLFDHLLIAKLLPFYEDIINDCIQHELISTPVSLGTASTKEHLVPPSRPRIESLIDGEDLTEEAYQFKLYEAINWLQSALADTSAETDYFKLSEIIDALVYFQSNDKTCEVIDQSPESLKDVEQTLRAYLQSQKEAIISNEHERAIARISYVFRYLLLDDVSDALKASVSQLYIPYLKVALIDDRFFTQSDHPARRLLNLMIEAGSIWLVEQDEPEPTMLAAIDFVVERIKHDTSQDLTVFQTLLHEFSSLNASFIRRYELVERRSKEQARGESKLDEVKNTVYRLITGALSDKSVPSAVLLLLLQPWSDYMAFILLRHGQRSESWAQAIKCVETTLFLIQPNTSRHEKIRQSALLEPYINRLEQGLKTIGYDRLKSQKLIDVMKQLCRLSLQGKTPPPADSVLREKLLVSATEKAGVAQNPSLSKNEHALLNYINTIEFGSWFYVDGERLKLSWYNPQASKFLFVNSEGKTIQTLTGIELVKKILSSQANLIEGSTKPFFERALESMYLSLKSRAPTYQSSLR